MTTLKKIFEKNKFDYNDKRVWKRVTTEWLQQKQEEVKEKYIVKGFQRMRLQAINELLEELE